MTALSFTAVQIRPLIPSENIKGIANVASMTLGDLVYKTSSTTYAPEGAYALADANAALTVEAVGVITAIQGGKSTTAAGDVITVTKGRIAGFSGLTPGALGYVSETAGDIEDAAPSGAGTWSKVVSRAESATVLVVDIDSEAAASNS